MSTPIERVPMPERRTAFISDDEVAVSESRMRVGRRISMDVDEEVFRRMGAEAIAYAVGRLAETVVHQHSHEIQKAVHNLILDQAWAEPIIRDEISKSVRAILEDMLNPPEPTEP